MKPVVTFAVPRSFPPYHSIGKDGRVTGFAIDVAKAIESRIGIEFRYQIHENWASIFAALKDGGADALANIGISPKRAGFLSFSLPYDTLRISYFVRATDTSTKTSDQLANAKIGVVEVNKARALLEKQGHPNLAIYPSLSDAMFALISSQVDAIAYPENIALKAARDAGVDNRLRIVEPALAEVKRAMAVRKGNSVLLTKFNKALAGFAQTEEFQEIYRKWFGAPTPFWNTSRVAFLVAAVVALSLLIFLAFRNWSAKQFTAQLQQTISGREAAQRELEETQANLQKLVTEQTAELRLEITERKEIHETLQENERRIRGIVESAADGIITTDLAGTILDINTAAEKIFGHKAKDVLGQNVGIMIPGNDTSKRDEYIREHLMGPAPSVTGHRREGEGLHRDGSVFPIEVSLSRADTRRRKLFTGIIRDITERKKAETELREAHELLKSTQDELVQSEKMASLGGLVAGVAHEINTPVGIGVTAASHLRKQTEELLERFKSGKMTKSDFENFLQNADESTRMTLANLERASNLIRSFKQVAVDHSSEEKRRINLTDYINEVLTSLAPKLKQSQHEVTVGGDTSINFESFPGAISQVITNLVMNSLTHAYAPGEPGRITITAAQEDTRAVLKYNDDGKGMDAETVEKIFDPFFTTKRGQGGSGLGMHILYNLITQTLSGSVTCRSEPGQGAEFTITLPLVNGGTT
ncbi:MAG: transporter substrate-binding domain-containing protein [Rhodospirillaceae bacterium]|nr:transporter substrate-binding domain-containing protein [Rhodospirillaceae bacterium]